MAEEYNNEEAPPEPKPFPKEMVADPESKTVGHQVRDYLWGKGPIDYALVSPHMKRELVLKFVEFEIRDLPPQYFWRVRIVADLYHFTELLGFLQSTLKRQENQSVDLDRSIANTITLDEIGDEGQKTFAVQYYEYLAQHRFANEKFHELIKCLAALGERANAARLRTRMEQETRSLASREGSDPEAEVERRDIEDLIENKFFIIEESNKSRRRILGISDLPSRLRELIKAYLELTDDGGAEYFALWVQQQFRRIAESNGAQLVIEAFRRAVRDLGKLNVRDSTFCKIRCYNAIEYFLGTLEPEEAEFMNKNRQKQIDPLRYMPVPLHIDMPDEEEPDEADEEEETETDEKE